MASRLYSPLCTLNPANSIVASEGIGIHALSKNMRANTPGSPRSETTLVANVTSVSVMDAEMSIAATAKGSVPAVPVPLFDTATPLEPLRGRLNARAVAVLDAGRYILGPEVEAFEEEFASYAGVSHGIGVANGTDAITIALRAMGVGEGDDVVVPSFTFYASVEAIPPTGARPVFCDVDPDTFCVTPDTVRAALTPRTKAVIAVHLFGNVAPVAEIEALGLPVLEDAAQAAGSTLDGAKAGRLGTAATFSFFPSKNLGAFGDGGAVVTGDAGVADRARTLRFHGSRDKVTYEHVGYNSRLRRLQAADPRAQVAPPQGRGAR